MSFRGESERYLRTFVPTGLILIAPRWTNRAGGFATVVFLTDIGGVQFGVGLDEGDPVQPMP